MGGDRSADDPEGSGGSEPAADERRAHAELAEPRDQIGVGPSVPSIDRRAPESSYRGGQGRAWLAPTGHDEPPGDGDEDAHEDDGAGPSHRDTPTPRPADVWLPAEVRKRLGLGNFDRRWTRRRRTA